MGRSLLNSSRNASNAATLSSTMSSPPSECYSSAHHDNQVVIETPILIVGAGPVGSALSLLLGRLAVPHVLVDRRASLDAIKNGAPQAHCISNRSMEGK